MSKLTILNRARFDEYFFDIALNIKSILNTNCATADFFYTHNLTDYQEFLKIYNSSADLIVIMFQEYITDVLTQTQCLDFLTQLSTKHRQIICVNSQPNAAADTARLNNIAHVCSGGYFAMQKNEYINLYPQKEKDFSADYHWISLSAHARPHRLIAGLILAGLGIDKNSATNTDQGLLRIESWHHHQYSTIEDWYKNKINLSLPDCWPIIKNGAVLLKEGFSGGQPTCITIEPLYKDNNNVANFDLLLRDLYKNTAVEIINETTFFNNGIFITEKFLNSVYGYNLPIILSNVGYVKYLRDNGFDLFDDVIDHSYDKVVDPVQRIYSAITCNRRLLTDRDYAIDVWNRCRSRMDRNIDFAKTQMYDHFKNQCLTDFTSLLQKLGY